MSQFSPSKGLHGDQVILSTRAIRAEATHSRRHRALSVLQERDLEPGDRMRGEAVVVGSGE